jgi:hypothetical protein
MGPLERAATERRFVLGELFNPDAGSLLFVQLIEPHRAQQQGRKYQYR